MKALRLSISLLITFLVLLSACSNNTDSTPTPTATPTQTFEPVTLQLEPTGEAWSDKFMQGLSGRTSLEGGMLFDFEDTVTFGFQMKETLIPLSIAFISEEFLIVDILDMEPLTAEHYGPSASYRYAIEVNQGFFTQNNIAVADRVEFQPSTVEGYISIVFFVTDSKANHKSFN
ncbi:DUF192 domain-containing protein [Chloroflexota bacterium]